MSRVKETVVRVNKNNNYCVVHFNQNKMEEQVVKRRLRTLGPRLQQELQVTIPHDLDRLESYRAAIENSQRVGDWDTLRRDQRNATLTIKVHNHTIIGCPHFWCCCRT